MHIESFLILFGLYLFVLRLSLCYSDGSSIIGNKKVKVINRTGLVYGLFSALWLLLIAVLVMHSGIEVCSFVTETTAGATTTITQNYSRLDLEYWAGGINIVGFFLLCISLFQLQYFLNKWNLL
jgi:hypothetical protein